ncbi:MAG: glutamate--tRNA ligase [Lentisphaerae bacterium]|nr:glutamate--tRNA ligase [Lentisphaerota bacterium]
MSNRVRFAPSPTGHVHIGNIRVAIFNWLFARHEGGKFLLRIEDTDRERHTKEAVDALFDVMNWLGLDYDEEPVFQSARRDAHLAAADRLLTEGKAYKEDKGNTGKGECIIFRMPNEDVVFNDEIKGELAKKAKDLQDFVIVRSDGAPVFHLANIVDDIDMKITHVIRGDDHVENTFRHVLIYKALGIKPPKYAHLPMIINQQGKPYSKRDGDCFVGEFRAKGFLADALFNYLAFLGWSPGGDREKLSRQELMELFSLDRVKSSPAQMDLKKLTHLNGQYVAELPANDFIAAAGRVVENYEWATGVDKDYFAKVCRLMQTRTHVYSFVKDWKYFFSDDIEYEEKPVRKMLKKPGMKTTLAVLRGKLDNIGFSEESIEETIRAVEKESNISEGKLNQPVRIAVTGMSTGAGLYETMALIGKARCLVRLGYAIDHLCEED